MLKRAFVITFAAVLNVAGWAFADEVVDGRVDGALYRLVRPSNWNGRLVLYAHGFVPSDAPLRRRGLRSRTRVSPRTGGP